MGKILAAIAITAVLALPAAALVTSTTEYYNHSRCGYVNPYIPAPLTVVKGDVDGDGKAEQFFANWGVVEKDLRQGEKPGESTFERLYVSSVNDAYVCVDLRLIDVDEDNDPDLVYASPKELVVLENKDGGFSMKQRYDFPAGTFNLESDVRISSAGKGLDLIVSDGTKKIGVK